LRRYNSEHKEHLYARANAAYKYSRSRWHRFKDEGTVCVHSIKQGLYDYIQEIRQLTNARSNAPEICSRQSSNPVVWWNSLVIIWRWVRLSGFGSFDFEFGAEYPVPESAGDAEAVGVVGVVVLEVVVFELAVVGWESVGLMSCDFYGWCYNMFETHCL